MMSHQFFFQLFLAEFLLVLMLLFPKEQVFASNAIRNIQTPKQMGLGGTGVAYPGLAEAQYTNPSFFSFFSQSSFYFYQDKGTFNPSSASRESTFGSTSDPSQLSLALSDGTNESKGGVSYQDIQESGHKRKRYGFSASELIDQGSSLGVSYSYTTDTSSFSSTSGKREEASVKSHTINLGYTQILSPTLTWGIVWYDPAWSDRINSKTVLGLNYKPLSMLTLLLDVGQDIKRSLNKTNSFSFAADLEVYEQVFVRYGMFQDRLFNIGGSAFGAGWMGPRLGFDVAVKKTQRLREFNTYLLQGEELKEIALSVLYIF